MPKLKNEPENTEKIIIRWSSALRKRCDEARKAGAHSSDAESTFVRFLIELGIKRYEKNILPLEKSDDENITEITSGVKWSPIDNMGKRGKLNKKIQGLSENEVDNLLIELENKESVEKSQKRA